MTPYLFWELLFLGVGVWLLAVVLVVYAWILLRRQKQMIDDIVALLKSNNWQPKPTSTLGDLRPTIEDEKSIAISKDEPISKYKDVTISDSVNVSFVEAHHDDED